MIVIDLALVASGHAPAAVIDMVWLRQRRQPVPQPVTA